MWRHKRSVSSTWWHYAHFSKRLTIMGTISLCDPVWAQVNLIWLSSTWWHYAHFSKRLTIMGTISLCDPVYAQVNLTWLSSTWSHYAHFSKRLTIMGTIDWCDPVYTQINLTCPVPKFWCDSVNDLTGVPWKLKTLKLSPPAVLALALAPCLKP